MLKISFFLAEVVEHCCSITSLQLGETLPGVAKDMDIHSYRIPLGVTAGITPFNFPAMIPLWVNTEFAVQPHSCLEISMISVVWTYDTFENNFEINQRFEEYFKEIFCLVSDEHFSFKYFFQMNLILLERFHQNNGVFSGSLGIDGIIRDVKKI